MAQFSGSPFFSGPCRGQRRHIGTDAAAAGRPDFGAGRHQSVPVGAVRVGVEHAVHVAAFEVVEKLEPAMQLAQTRLVVGVHAVEANWPALQVAHVLHAGAVAPVPMA